MTPTFYVAGPSSHVLDVRLAVRDLEALGLRCAFDWTSHIGAPANEWPSLAGHDVDAARYCDLFVLLAEYESEGGMLELGVRLGRSDRVAHVVSPGRRHFFMFHPSVTWWRDWATFLGHCRGLVARSAT